MLLARTDRQISLRSEIESALIKNVNSRTIPHYLQERSKIILLNSQGYYNNEIASMMCLHPNTVSKWVNRFRSKMPDLLFMTQDNNHETFEIDDVIEMVLSDDVRTGRPLSFDLSVRFFIVWICCQSPRDYGFVSDMWHLPQIQLAVIESEIVNTISIGGIYKILVSYDLYPWKNRYYLHSKDKYENNDIFTKKIENINLIYHVAQEHRQAISMGAQDSDDLFTLTPIEGENLQDTLKKEEEKILQKNNTSDSSINPEIIENNDENHKINSQHSDDKEKITSSINSEYLKKCAAKFKKAFGNSQEANEEEIENFFYSLAKDDVDDISSSSKSETDVTTYSTKENLDAYEKYHEDERDENIHNKNFEYADKTTSSSQSLLPFLEPVEVHIGEGSVPQAENTTHRQQSLLPFTAPVEVHDSEDTQKKENTQECIKELEKKLEEIKKAVRKNVRLFNKIQELAKKIRLLDAEFARCDDKENKANLYYKRAVNLFREVFRNANIDRLFSIYSFDEMTGVQALEDASERKNPLPGVPGYKEFNYIRHGVLSLIAFLDIITGKVRIPFMNTTRDENDVAEAFFHIIANDPGKVKYIFICDNLNVHKSEALVRMVAEFCGITEDLGVKGRRGILKNCESREEFLSDSSHRIFFLYTPVHCSWMNQIEIFFSVMSRQFIKQSSFKSLKDLKVRIVKYINIYNRLFSHGFNWKYNDVPKQRNKTSLFISAITASQNRQKAA